MIAVVGAGPAGLAAAWRAARAGHEVVVLERAPAVGGMAGSFEVAGLRVDFGSHRLHPATPPEVLGALRDLLGDDLQVRPRNGRIRLHDRWIAFPLRTGDLLRRAPRGFAARALRDVALGPLRRPRDDTFAERVRAGLGPAVLDAFYGPFARKLWGTEAGELAGELAGRRISASSPLDIVGRLVRAVRPQGRTFLYPRTGFGALSEALADAAVAAGATIRLNAGVRALRWAGPSGALPAGRAPLDAAAEPRPEHAVAVPPGQAGGLRPGVDPDDGSDGGLVSGSRSRAGGPRQQVAGADTSGAGAGSSAGGGHGAWDLELDDGSRLDAEQVWSTAPLGAVVGAIEPAAPEAVGAALGRLRHRAMVLLYLVLDQPQWTPFDAHYFPGPEVIASRLSEPRNYRDNPDDPPDVTVLCAEIPCGQGDEIWQASDDELAGRLGEELAAAGLPAVKPAQVESRRLPRVYPIYRRGFAGDLAAVEEWASALPGFVTFGRQGLFTPDNTHHALAMGWSAAACLRPDGSFDTAAWRTARDGFRSYVVED